MGKLVNGKFLRLGFTSNWSGSGDVGVNWVGWKAYKDDMVNDYVRGLIRDMMGKREDSFRDWGFWFSKCEFYLRSGVIYFGVYLYEGDIDNFCGRVVYRDEYIDRRDMGFVRWLRRKVYGYITKMIELDFRMVFGIVVKVVIFPIRLGEVTSNVLGELVVRRVYDGEKIQDIFKDLKRGLIPRRVRVKLRRRRKPILKNSLRKRNRYFLLGLIRKLKKIRKKRFIRMTLLRIKYFFMRRGRRRVLRRMKRRRGRLGIGGIRGFRIEGKGMFVRKHKSMSQFVKMESGYVALATIKEPVDYSEMHVNLRTSKCGVKVWLDKANSGLRGRFKQSVNI
jgi:hypothetical protein